MSEEYEREEKVFRTILETCGIQLEAGTIPKPNYITHGHRCRGQHTLLPVEGKNEIEAKGAEPIFQALASYKNAVGTVQLPSDVCDLRCW
jgi:hypothetical protein